MRKTNEFKTTVNRSVYNKLYKRKNASCPFCKWHGPTSENDRWKWYGLYQKYNGGKKVWEDYFKHPNWKLVSKNRKQWMKKPIKKIEDKINGIKYVEFKW